MCANCVQAVEPRALVDSGGALRLNGHYYITHQIIPALERLLSLVWRQCVEAVRMTQSLARACTLFCWGTALNTALSQAWMAASGCGAWRQCRALCMGMHVVLLGHTRCFAGAFGYPTYIHARCYMHIHTCTYIHARCYMHIHTCTLFCCGAFGHPKSKTLPCSACPAWCSCCGHALGMISSSHARLQQASHAADCGTRPLVWVRALSACRLQPP